MGLLNSKSAKRPAPSQPRHSNVNDDCGDKETAHKNILVLHRIGSQFFDKDGDLAHEFYEEVRLPDGHTTMQRITADLRPQGLVIYDHPRLHPDYPYVLV